MAIKDKLATLFANVRTRDDHSTKHQLQTEYETLNVAYHMASCKSLCQHLCMLCVSCASLRQLCVSFASLRQLCVSFASLRQLLCQLNVCSTQAREHYKCVPQFIQSLQNLHCITPDPLVHRYIATSTYQHCTSVSIRTNLRTGNKKEKDFLLTKASQPRQLLRSICRNPRP